MKPKFTLGAEFLLTQIGAHAASQFATRLAELDLTPAHAGILRILSLHPGLSQQALATALRTVPSRLVTLVDELESKGLVQRLQHESDRRTHALHITEDGEIMMQKIASIGLEHRERVLASLSNEEKQLLTDLLQKIADEQGLLEGVHPGYARLEPKRKSK